MSTSPTEPAGDESYSAPSSDDEHEQDEAGDGGPETGTPFASEGGGSPDSVTDEPRERDEPQRSE